MIGHPRNLQYGENLAEGNELSLTDRHRIESIREKIMKIEWIDGSGIKTAIENKEIVISANREGLLSLAKQLTTLADGVPGDHIHYDAYNSLEEGSAEMIIELL